MGSGFPSAQPNKSMWEYLHYLYDNQGSLIDGFPGKTWFVDAFSGNASDTDGDTWDNAFATMAQAFAKIASGDRIFFKGKIREQLTTPAQVFDVQVIGIGNRPRHADAAPVGGNIGANTWTTPASPASPAAPLCKVLQQGWAFVNILFAGPTDHACVQLYRDAGAGDLERDASHASFIGCRFASGFDAISDTGGCFNVLVKDNVFEALTGFCIRGVGNIGVGQSEWLVTNNNFVGFTNGVKISGYGCRFQYNFFTDGATPNTNVVLNTAFVAGDNCLVVDNYFQTSNANFDTPDIDGNATDVWRNVNIDGTDTAGFEQGAP